jgi:hypothetical protein
MYHRRYSTNPNPSEIQNFCRAFVELQELRHIADYDVAATFNKSDCRAKINIAVTAVSNFYTISSTNKEQVLNLVSLIMLGNEKRS